MCRHEPSFLECATRWLIKNEHVRSAAVFGSTARMLRDGQCIATKGADIDIHMITGGTTWLAAVDWMEEIGRGDFCLRAARSATGGVRKWSIVYSSAQMDIVVVPAIMMYAARLGFRLGLYQRVRILRTALNEMASCLRLGFFFVKGERQWGSFYRKISLLPGVRLADAEIVELATAALCDGLWVLQKLEVGEVVAAQHVLHSRVADTNLRLWRELRMRESLPLPSFGLGRKLEVLLEPEELSALRVSSLAVANDLERATRGALAELQRLVSRLCPDWSVSAEMNRLLLETGPSCLHP